MSDDIRTTIEQWGVFEVSLTATTSGNPLTDVSFGARFRHRHRVVEVDGFYDGDDNFRVRVMPDTQGEWYFETFSNCDELNDRAGVFLCEAPSENNHGPVRVHDTYHFAYADGTPFYPIGTTCYVWNHQSPELQEQTLQTLPQTPFNKLRMCVFPKDYDYNKREPQHYPYERDESRNWDFSRFNPVFFRALDRQIERLMALGIEADIILFHPYDRWGFSKMDSESDDRYLRYVISRLAAYRNVWWSLANEYELLKEKVMGDWDRFFRIVQESDHAGHLRSIHNCWIPFYDHGKPWVTHSSIQSSELHRVAEWRGKYLKPVIVDECCYEGNINHCWGNISAREMVHRFWLGTVLGGYVGHGETYEHPKDILWWSHGGVLHGKSAPRIAFLKQILSDGPAIGFTPTGGVWDDRICCKGEDYYLYYYGEHQPSWRTYTLPEDKQYRAEILDTWEMSITQVEGTYSGAFRLDLPGKPYMAVRFMRVEE